MPNTLSQGNGFRLLTEVIALIGKIVEMWMRWMGEEEGSE
jgi:hypothetical protein